MHLIPPLEAPIDPATALRRIAFHLERERAGRYRVEAFRKAAVALKSLPDDELRSRSAHGSGIGGLAELPGIGSKTAVVIAQALAGEVPEYLAQLQTGVALTSDGATLYSALRGDCHSHSDWSDGGSPIDEMALTAWQLGQEWLVLTDHSPRLKIANGLSAARLTKQLAVVDALAAAFTASDKAFKLLKGIEVDILDDGTLDQQPDLLAQLDLVVASVHSKLAMASAAMTTRMLSAVRNPRVNVLGHCTGRLVEGSRGTRAQSRFDARAVFEACAENNVAVEINSRPERCDPPDDLLSLARDIGCLFAIDSDAHAPGQLDMKAFGCARAEAHGIRPDRIITTWDAERLLDWAQPA